MTKQSELLKRTTDQILPDQTIEQLLSSNKQLRIKYGVDVTAPFMHIGHAVNLWQMRLLQDLGHKVVFLIGDFTTKIGDPTGKSQTRPIIPEEDIQKNANEYITQVGKILRTDEDVFEVRRNSEWYGKMPLDEFLGLLSMVTHSHMIQREMFQTRIDNKQEIRMHELVYPVLQGYDSYMLNADLTIVGSDQLFNENMGRFYQQKFGQSPQSIITTRITPGLDGKNKQSKSLNNYIALEDTPRNKFGKIMSLPDDLIMPYFEVYTDRTNAEIQDAQERMDSGKNPSHIKKQLATAIVERYHGSAAAEAELQWFTDTFSRKKKPEDLRPLSVDYKSNALSMIKAAFPGKSNNEIRRLCEQGAIRLNDEKLLAFDEERDINKGDVLKVGKKDFFELLPKEKNEPRV